MINTYAHYHRGCWPTALKEDFAGSSAIAAQWVATEDDHEAVAVESHGPTLRHARRRTKRVLGSAAKRVQFIEADVVDVTQPQVDVVCALNFSVLIWHDRKSLVRYFRAARRSLKPGGLLVVDVYGGPGSQRQSSASRVVTPDPEEDVAPFEYVWEQKQFDHRTRRTDCRIHFEVGGRQRSNVFCYDWRLWTPQDLCAAMREAGFSQAQIWADGGDGGPFQPLQEAPSGQDWVAYIVGVLEMG